MKFYTLIIESDVRNNEVTQIDFKEDYLTKDHIKQPTTELKLTIWNFLAEDLDKTAYSKILLNIMVYLIYGEFKFNLFTLTELEMQLKDLLIDNIEK